MEIEGKKIAIIGAGRTGLAAARFCKAHGGQPIINDLRTREDLGAEAQNFEELGAELRLGGHDTQIVADCDGAIVSPGVGPEIDALQELRRKGVPVLGEMELASRYAKAPIVAVTGTNGKSTVVTLIQAMLEASGVNASLGGNIGTPFLDLILEAESQNASTDVYVLEVSSYQLESIETFHPYIAVLLNISPDHLSRHHSIAAYVAAKGRIFTNQDTEDWAVFNADDAHVQSVVASARSRKLPWSLRRPITPGLFRKRDQVIWFHEGHQETYDISQFSLAGDHQLENAMAAAAAARLAGATMIGVQETLDKFNGLPHRFEFVGSHRGIHFVNDSKATNVGAAVRAVEGIPQEHLILLAGGEDKGSSYEPLKEAVLARHAKAVCVYGEAAGQLQETLGDALPTFRQTTLEEAFGQAMSQADDGDFILLAPACASFDQFTNFEHRGDAFRQLVQQLGPDVAEANL